MCAFMSIVGEKIKVFLEVYEVDFIFCPQVPSPSVVMTCDKSFRVYASRWLSQYLELYGYPRIYMHVHICRHAHTCAQRWISMHACIPTPHPPHVSSFYVEM